jgi:hypothetical protein
MHAGRIHAGRILAGRLHAARILSVLCIAGSGALVGSSHGFDLWSTKDSFMGSGQFIGPGANTAEQPLFPVIIRNMLFTTNVDFITPFKNNAALGDTICALRETQSADHSHLSDGTQVNDNVDTCSAVIAGTKMAVAIVNGGPFQGEQKTVTTLKDGNVIMTMDIALDLGIGPKGVIRLPFFGTTGSVTIPKSMQTQMGGKGTDQAGKYPSGTVLTGRIGDFNGDGWIDGVLVATGVMPLDSPLYPGQPYALYRSFETNIPIEGVMAGDVKDLQAAARKLGATSPRDGKR